MLRCFLALKKDVFFEILTLDIDEKVCDSIIKEINDEIDFRINQLHELQDLFSSDNCVEKISDVLK